MSRVVIVGAGVTGLTTACLLSDKGYDVTIVAKKFSYDGYDPYFCSNHAGANWQSAASREDLASQEIDKPAYTKFMTLARTEPKSGVLITTHKSYISREKYDQMGGNFATPWWSTFVEDFKVIPAAELPQDVAYGTSYTGFVINTSVYLAYLLGRCLDNGVVYKRKTLDHVSEAQMLHSSGLKAHVVVNCTGLSSKYLGGVTDDKLVSVKGQVLLVENTCPHYLNVNIMEPQHPYERVYLMPRREGGTIIGGNSIPGDYSPEPDLEMAERFKARALKYCPQLVDPRFGNPPTLKVVRHMVGFRPVRKTGVRVERDPGIPYLVHNYGVGGSGYQSSYGTCKKTVALVDDILNRAKL